MQIGASDGYLMGNEGCPCMRLTHLDAWPAVSYATSAQVRSAHTADSAMHVLQLPMTHTPAHRLAHCRSQPPQVPSLPTAMTWSPFCRSTCPLWQLPLLVPPLNSALCLWWSARRPLCWPMERGRCLKQRSSGNWGWIRSCLWGGLMRSRWGGCGRMLSVHAIRACMEVGGERTQRMAVAAARRGFPSWRVQHATPCQCCLLCEVNTMTVRDAAGAHSAHS